MFVNQTEFIEMGVDFKDDTKRTVFIFKGYYGKELTSEREYSIALQSEDIDRIIHSLELVKERLK